MMEAEKKSVKDRLMFWKKGAGADFAQKALDNDKVRGMTSHLVEIEELEKELDTDAKNLKGLTEDRALVKLDKFGKNALTEKKAKKWYVLFIEELTGFFSLLLWFGAFLCFIGYAIDRSDMSNLYLGITLATVVLITGVFSYFQASKSAALMAQFKDFIPQMTNVIRDGKEKQIKAADLVPGDLVKIKGGDNIPADVRIIDCYEMKVNNASLTGESEDLLRSVDHNDCKNPLETENLAFFGTQCTQGVGTGVVIETGDRTVIGQIANLAQSAHGEQTPLSIEINRFIKIVSGVAIFLGVTFFFLGIFYGYHIITNLVFMIGIIVANVPEGLLATVTVSLALTAKRMARKMVLVKNMESVETLGSTTCICSDKTGTLTQNRMTVSHLWYNLDMHDASVNYEQVHKKLCKAEDIDYDVENPEFKELLRTLTLGTKAFFDFKPDEDRLKRKIGKIAGKSHKKVNDADVRKYGEKATQALEEEENNKSWQLRDTSGDASESGLIKFAQPVNDLEQKRAEMAIHSFKDEKGETVNCEIPFNSTNKYNLIIRDMSQSKDEADQGHADRTNFMLIMKGAPEKIFHRCSRILINGEEIEINDTHKQQYDDANADLGKQGERVLAFARVYLDPSKFTRDYKFNFDPEGYNFPMEDLCFVGLASLNDPPRVFVDHSVDKCRIAGIKVIMVTGDQPVTAAAIAKKVNIIKEGSKVNVDLIEEGMTHEEAFENCDAVVVHGDELSQKHTAEAELDDDDPEKGRFMLNWINKKEVVFARTTPSQKLLIVDACQKAGHIVAVTGDGVNDSPAIKKANIGIAMGSGSDVAQNAADMLLLDDDFSSIVNGVEEGRLIFDNLKKSIAYTLSSNIPEIAPFIFFILLQIPLPLSTVLILCIDLGTDMVPAISMAYEGAELDIMIRKPRNSKRDHLVNTKLISFAYLQIGMIQASAGFYTYFLVMNDYGFKPFTLLGLAPMLGVEPGENDTYDATLGPCKGNSECNKGGERRQLEYNSAKDNWIDVRLFYHELPPQSWSECRFADSEVRFFRQAYNLGDWNDICYSTEALRCAQCAYLVSIVCVQWADLMICKTRNLSISQQGMKNWMLDFGLVFETVLVAILCYFTYLNLVLGTRMIAPQHFCVPSFPFFTVIFFYDEARKMFLRAGVDKDTGRFRGWVVQNTYY